MTSKYQGETFSFVGLLRKSKIEIPIIQRDYAQGRKDKNEIRLNFLTALRDSFIESRPIMLDFVYGSAADSSFQPLDGQQRLTTLFLLHWYAAKKEEIQEHDETILKRFSYETRITSRDFCLALVSKPIAIAEDVNISETIVDSSWFFLSWKNDPTIDAMLRTIEDIHRMFFHVPNMWENLTNENSSLIRFYCVELENIGLTDDLYIKMNARGKLLTSFENFKASFQKRINEEGWEAGCGFNMSFAYQIDTTWTDLFWKYFRKNDKIDDAFIKFISTIVMIRKAIERDGRNEERFEVIKTLHDDPNNVKAKYFSRNDFKYLIECFQLYEKHYETILSYGITFPFWRHRPKNTFLNAVVNEDSATSYTQKVLFFAQTEYFRLVKDFNLERYQEWMRVVRNIISRGDIEKSGKRPDIVRSPQTFDGVINLISELSDGCNDIYTYLNSCQGLKSTFAREQMDEERRKAKLIVENPSLKQDIFAFEDTDLLRGKIDFIFHCINYEKDTDEFNENLFRLLQIAISDNFKVESDVSNDLRRALLTISVDNKYEFYGYWWSSWGVIKSDKRCLIETFREIEYFIYSEYRDYFKNLVLELSKGYNFKQIVSKFSPPADFPNWKRRLIEESDLLDKQSKSNYIAIPEDNSCCYLLKSKRPRDQNGCVKIE